MYLTNFGKAGYLLEIRSRGESLKSMTLVESKLNNQDAESPDWGEAIGPRATHSRASCHVLKYDGTCTPQGAGPTTGDLVPGSRRV